MKKVLNTLLLMVAVFFIAFPAQADTINFYLYNWEGAMRDTDGSLIPAGSRFEFLWAGANGVIDPLQAMIDTPEFLTPGGDDVLMRVYAVGDGIPQAYVPSGYYDGHIEAFVLALDLEPYDEYGDPMSPYDDNFYVRFFNADDPLTQLQETQEIGWGESDVFQITMDDVNLGFAVDINFSPVDDLFITQTLMIPEPLSFILVLLGSAVLVIRRIKK